MNYYIGQVCGIAVTVLGIVYPLCRQKKWMLILSLLVNVLAGINVLLVGGFGAAVLLNLTAVLQIACTLWHFRSNTPIPLWEKILFLCLFMGLGMTGVAAAQGMARWLELLPVAAVIPFCISVFVRDEQNTRKLMLINLVLLLIYYIAIGSTMVAAQSISLVTTVAALIRYRKKVDVK